MPHKLVERLQKYIIETDTFETVLHENNSDTLKSLVECIFRVGKQSLVKLDPVELICKILRKILDLETGEDFVTDLETGVEVQLEPSMLVKFLKKRYSENKEKYREEDAALQQDLAAGGNKSGKRMSAPLLTVL